MSVKISTAARATAPVLCLMFSAAVAQTPANKETTIHLKYVTIQDRLRPNPESSSKVERTIVAHLSAGGAISEVYGRGEGAEYKEYGASGHFGADAKSGAGLVKWHVVSANALVRIRELDQSIQTITVNVNGSNCEMTFNEELKPGFTEVKYISITTMQTAYYTLARASETSCTIE